MTQMADVPAVLILSFSTPDLSSAVPTLPSSIFSTGTALLSSHTTTLTSSRALFFFSFTTPNLLLTSSAFTWTQRTVDEYWRRYFWRAVLLLSDQQCWVTLTTVGDSWCTLLTSSLEWLREWLLHDLTCGTPLHLTGDLLSYLALLGDVPKQPADRTLGSFYGALPGDLFIGPPFGDLPLQPASSLRPVALWAGLPTCGEALLSQFLHHPLCWNPCQAKTCCTSWTGLMWCLAAVTALISPKAEQVVFFRNNRLSMCIFF